jgi:hypothetical protein
MEVWLQDMHRLMCVTAPAAVRLQQMLVMLELQQVLLQALLLVCVTVPAATHQQQIWLLTVLQQRMLPQTLQLHWLLLQQLYLQLMLRLTTTAGLAPLLPAPAPHLQPHAASTALLLLLLPVQPSVHGTAQVACQAAGAAAAGI